MRKGFKDCPMPNFELDVDAHGEEGVDEIQIGLLEKAMGHYIKRKRGQQRKRQIRTTGRQLLGRSACCPVTVRTREATTKKSVCSM